MNVSLNSDQQVASVFSWLLQLDHSKTAEAIRQAIALDLVKDNGENLWSVSSERINKYLATHPPLPQNKEVLCNILYGLGELKARCHDISVDADNMLPTIIGKSVGTYEILNMATSISQTRRPFTRYALATGGSIARSLNWNTLDEAYRSIYHYPSARIYGHYGLSFIISYYLKNQPQSVLDWVTAQPLKAKNAVIPIEQLNQVLAFNPQMQLIRLMLDSRNNYIQLLGSAGLIYKLRDNNLSIDHALKALVESDIDNTDAAWIIGLYYKELIHNWYRLSSHVETETRRLASVSKYPELSRGSEEYANQEIEHLEISLSSNNDSLQANIEQTNKFVNSWATSIRDTVIDDKQFQYLKQNFVNSAEHYYKLASSLPENHLLRTKLLQENIAAIKKLLSDGEEINLFSDHTEMMKWGALSFIAMNDNKDLSKKVGQLISPYHKKLCALTASPYLHATAQTTWRNHIGQLALTNLFPLLCIDYSDKEQHDLSVLANYSIDGALETLLLAQNNWSAPHDTKNLLDTLLRQLIWLSWNFGEKLNLKDFRAEWITNSRLPDHVKALAVWSSTMHVLKDTHYAISLLQKLAEKPLNDSLDTQQLNRILTVIDVGIASAFKENKLEALPFLHEFWSTVLNSWKDKIPAYLIPLTHDLVEAIQSKEIGQGILNEDGFENSYSINYVKQLDYKQATKLFDAKRSNGS